MKVTFDPPITLYECVPLADIHAPRTVTYRVVEFVSNPHVCTQSVTIRLWGEPQFRDIWSAVRINPGVIRLSEQVNPEHLSANWRGLQYMITSTCEPIIHGISLSWRKTVIEPQKWNCQFFKIKYLKRKCFTSLLCTFKGAL